MAQLCRVLALAAVTVLLGCNSLLGNEQRHLAQDAGVVSTNGADASSDGAPADGSAGASGCDTGESLCGSACVATDTDNLHCGDCTRRAQI
jgi:hypothetical protein